ncbi:MAG: hypothetical protein WD270_09505 [Acetobacterales bacterium]
MPDDDHDLIRHLFALATAVLEDAIEEAVAGQVHERSPALSATSARALRIAAEDLHALAAAAGVVARRGVEAERRPREGPF